MSYTFRRAVKEQVGLIIGLYGSSRSGKTRSAFRLAQGIVGPNEPFAMIDTERRRGLHYANRYTYDYCELAEPFTPDAYTEAIMAAEKAGYKAIVVDSMSHVWAGPGGVLDWQEAELQRMAGDNYQKREACKMAAWIKPKASHKRMVQRLLQVNTVLILCFRAEEKVKMVKKDGKTEIVPIGWQPICDKNLPYELTVPLLLTPEEPGVPHAIVTLDEEYRAFFPEDKQIDEGAGQLIAKWAKGGAPKPAPVSADIRKRFEADIAGATTPSDLDPVKAAIRAQMAQMDKIDVDALVALCKKRAEELTPVQTTQQPEPHAAKLNDQSQMFIDAIDSIFDEMNLSEADRLLKIADIVGRQVPLTDLDLEELVKVNDALCQEG